MLTVFSAVASMTFFCRATEPQVPPVQVFDAAAHLGLTAESLACVGINGADVGAVLDRLADGFGDYQTYLELLGDAAVAHDRMVAARAAARLDPHDAAAIADLQAAENFMQAIVAEAQTDRADLIRDLTESLSSHQDVADVFMSPQSLNLPAAYRGVELNDVGVHNLAWALSLRDRLRSDSLPSRATDLISVAESQYRVQLALIRLQQHGEANHTAMLAWLNRGL